MAFSDLDIARVWMKGRIVPGYDASLYRQDDCGAWMTWKEYGNRNSVYGWEIDHVLAVANGGSDAFSNLRPLQWENNAQKQDGRLLCPVISSSNENIRRGLISL